MTLLKYSESIRALAAVLTIKKEDVLRSFGIIHHKGFNVVRERTSLFTQSFSFSSFFVKSPL